MQRYLALIALFVFSLPVGLSIAGCSTQVGNFCNGLGYGPLTSAVQSIALQPETTGISLSWGQTGQISAPSAINCKGATETVANYIYGSSNLLLADISPTGAICGGTWNRNSPGGIAEFTICTPPTGAATEQCTSTSCGVATITATGAGVTSNPVPVYVHPPVTSISVAPQSACVSQNHPGPTLSATVNGPNGITIPGTSVGTITYTPVTSSVVTINNTSTTGTGTNGATTANLPGSTVVNASVAQVSAAAGYFYTCPPQSIALSINGGTSAIVNPSTPQNIIATVTDTNNVILSGTALDFTSTRPQEIAVSSAGQVSATYATDTAINAICQPTTCNPSPIGQIGYLGNGIPVVSNTLNVTSTGRVSTLLWMASTQSQYFSQIDLTTGVPTSPIRLPYIPNSMVVDQAGNNLYFGSYRELMIYSALTNGLTKEDTTVPGVVLAVSPDSTTVVINDQLRQVIYLYTVSTGTNTSIGGLGTRATFSPDGKNVYIVGEDSKGNGTLYVHNANSGWSTYPSTFNFTPPPVTAGQGCTLNNNSPLAPPATGAPIYDPFCGADTTLTIPSVGAFISGSTTTAHSFCANTIANPPYYPPAGTVSAETDKLATTNNGTHIFGANAAADTFSDIGVTVPPGSCPYVAGTAPLSGPPFTFSTTLNQVPLTGITPTEIDQVVASPDSTVAFVLYNSASATGLLPAYQPSTSTTPGTVGTLNTVQLSGGAQAPLAGIFSPDESIFFVSTSGDNLIHYVNPVTLTDTQTINPGLTSPTGQTVPVQMLAVKPRPTT
jgi:trimeric autotransporter adhesin